jgi:hypothetical protein
MERATGTSLGLVLLATTLGAACGDSSGTPGAGGAGGGSGGGESTASTSGAGAGSYTPADPHTPEGGCRDGYQVCDDRCVRIGDDARHCGGCGLACDLEDACNTTVSCGCVAGACVPDQGCLNTATCLGECADDMFRNVDHCGSCENRCGDLELCVLGTCVDGGGDGSTCESPLTWTGANATGFRLGGAPGSHTFSCGPAGALPTRWFAVTIDDAQTAFEVEGDDADDFVVEVFTDCGGTSIVTCADDDPAGQEEAAEVDGIAPGTTFFVAVGVKGGSPGGPAVLDVE